MRSVLLTFKLTSMAGDTLQVTPMSWHKLQRHATDSIGVICNGGNNNSSNRGNHDSFSASHV